MVGLGSSNKFQNNIDYRLIPFYTSLFEGGPQLPKIPDMNFLDTTWTTKYSNWFLPKSVIPVF